MMKYIFLLLFIAEIIAWSVIKQSMSVWMILWACLIAMFIGAGLLKNSLVGLIPALNQLQSSVNNKSASQLIVKSACGVVAGALFIFPGFVSDFIAVLLLLPPTQFLLRHKIIAIIAQRKNNVIFGQMGNGSIFSGGFTDIFTQQTDSNNTTSTDYAQKTTRKGTTIDGEAREVVSDVTTDIKHLK